MEQCLHSVFASHTNFEYEVLVVDNNSADGSVDYLQSRFTDERVRFFRNTENTGFAKANNQAIRQAKGEYVLLLNPDTIIGENILSRICRFLDENPMAGAVGVKTINGQGKFLPESKRGFPTPWASFCKVSGLSLLFPQSAFFGGYNLNHLDENQQHEVPVLVGSFMIIRQSALRVSGLFDESFFMYGEDIDLSYRIAKSGYTNYYLPEKVLHFKGESSSNNHKEYNRAFHDAMRIFFRKYYPGKALLSFFVSLAINIRAFLMAFKNTSDTKNIGVKILNTQDMSYEEMIDYMDRSKPKNLQYRIYNPQTGTTIGDKFAEKTVDHAS